MFIVNFLGLLWNLFWSIWPKNFVFLCIMSAICEASSVSFFKISGNRGFFSFIGYILGFFVVAFYAEATKYSKISQSYPIYLVAIAVCITIASYFFLHEKISTFWFVGFILAMIGVLIMQLALPAE